MAQGERKARPQFSQPVRQVTLMLLALGLTGFGAFVALPRVLPVFQANPYLNGFILFVFVIGVVACFWQLVQLIGSVRWIERFAAESADLGKAPQLLAPLATLLRARGARSQINASSTRSILDSVATRIDEAREITRYIVNMLIFLGLLGTFYGLATTVPGWAWPLRRPCWGWQARWLWGCWSCSRATGRTAFTASLRNGSAPSPALVSPAAMMRPRARRARWRP